MRVLLAYSGGLDTSWLIAWLTRERGHSVTTLAVDCGGWSDAERVALEERALELGAVAHQLHDARQDLFDRVLRWLVAGNVRRGGAYPLSVGAERGLQAEVLAQVAIEQGFDAVAHGCTAAGNDQVRFEAALTTVAPQLEVLAPVRDLAPSREEQAAYLEERKLPVPPHGGLYSVNAGLWGVTIGGAETHTSSEALPEEAWLWTRDGAGSAKIDVSFEGGVPVALNGEALGPVALIERLNVEAGKLGVGRGYHLGDTVLGFKGRIGYEAPAAEVLLTAHRELEKLVLTEDQRFHKDHLADLYGRRLHQGLFHDPFQRDVEAFLASSQKRVTGVAHIQLAGGPAGGTVLVEGVESPFSLMAASGARYGERAAPNSDPSAALGIARTFAEPARLWRAADQQKGSGS
jgi:argininosuccinate synthase